jgi:hypothetical protein
MTPVAVPAAPPAVAATASAGRVASEPSASLERVARGLRGARARTHLSEADVAAILRRQGIALTVSSLRRAESTGTIDLALAACLADLYGTTTDGLAGRGLYRRKPWRNDTPAGC